MKKEDTFKEVSEKYFSLPSPESLFSRSIIDITNDLIEKIDNNTNELNKTILSLSDSNLNLF